MKKDFTSSKYKKQIKNGTLNSETLKPYFDEVINILVEERKPIAQEQETKLSEIEDNREVEIARYSEMLSKVNVDHDEAVKELNKQHEQKLLKINNESFSKKQIIELKIENEQKEIDSIKSKLEEESLEFKKEALEHIKSVNARIDDEYNKLTDTLFESKQAVTDLEEKFVKSCLEETSSIESLIEALEQTTNVTTGLNNPITFNESIKKLEELDSSLSSCIVKKSSKNKDTKELSQELSGAIRRNKESFARLYRKEVKNLEEKFETISNEESKYSDLLKENEVLRSKIKYDIDFDIARKVNALSKYLDKFDKSFKSLNSDSYVSLNELSNTIGDFIQQSVSSLLAQLKKSEADHNTFKKSIQSFTTDISKLSIEAKIKVLKEYKVKVNEIISNIKNLTHLIFEIVSSCDVEKMKVLDLKRNFLTIDDQTKIKEINYEYDIKIKEATKENVNKIEEYKTELSLLDKDCEDDFLIENNKFDENLSFEGIKLETERNRITHMKDFTKLDNTKDILTVQNQFVPLLTNYDTLIEQETLTYNELEKYVTNTTSYDLERAKYVSDVNDAELEYYNMYSEIEQQVDALNSNYQKSADEISNQYIPEIESLDKEIKQKELSLAKEIKKIKKESEKALAKENAELIKEIEKIENDISSIDGFLPAEEDYQSYELQDATDKIKDNLTSLNDKISSLSAKYGIKPTSADLSEKDISKYYQLQTLNKRVSLFASQATGLLKKKFNKILSDKKAHLETLSAEDTTKLSPIISPLEDECLKETGEIQTRIDSLNDDLSTRIEKIDKKRTRAEKKLRRKLRKKLIPFEKQLDKVNLTLKKFDKKIPNRLVILDKTLKEIDLKAKEIYQNNYSSINNSKSNLEKIESIISDISNEMRTVNKKLEVRKDELKKKNEFTIRNIAKDAEKNYFNQMKNKKAIIKDNQDSIQSLITNKDAFLTSLKKDSLKFKEHYPQSVKNVDRKMESAKADKLVEYSKLIEKIKEVISQDYNKCLDESMVSIEKMHNDTNDLINESSALHGAIRQDILDVYENTLKGFEELDSRL